LGVEVEGSSIAIGRSIGSRGSSIGNSRGSCNSRGSSIDSWGGSNSNWSLSSIESSLGVEMFSSGSSNSGLISRDNSTIRVGNQLGVEVEGASIAIGRSIGSRGSSIGERACNSKRSSWSSCIESSLGSKVLSSGSSNSWLINWGHSSIRVANQAKESLARAEGKRSSKNQKLHV